MADKEDAKPKKQSTIKQIIQIYKYTAKPKTRPCRGCAGRCCSWLPVSRDRSSLGHRIAKWTGGWTWILHP